MMRRSIEEFWKKIKHISEVFLQRERVFTVVLLILTALASYGLGVASSDIDTHDQAGPVIVEQNSETTDASRDTHVPDRSDERVNAASDGGSTEAAELVGSVNSDKYHLPWCSGAKRISEENEIWFSSREEAEAAGYAPAGNCKGLE